MMCSVMTIIPIIKWAVPVPCRDQEISRDIVMLSPYQ